MDLRYPIGRFVRSTEITPAQRDEWISQMAAAPAELRAATAGLTCAQLDEPYRPGGWTVRQVVHHLPDSHLNGYMRFKLALTEDEPVIRPFDVRRWALLPDSTGPVAVSLALFDALQVRWVTLLRAMTPQDWSRTFRHPVNGVWTLDAALGLHAWHGRHHIAHITALREQTGWHH